MARLRYLRARALAVAFLTVAMPARAQTPALLLKFELVEEMHDPRTAQSDRERLLLVSDEFATQIGACTAFGLVDSAPAQATIDETTSRIAYVHRCNGCASDFGKAAGAQLVLFPWVQKVSNLILNLNVEIRTAQTDEIVAARSVDIRGNTDKAWLRGARALAKRLCELDGNRLSREPPR